VANLLLTKARRSADGSIQTRLAQTKAVNASRLGLAPETFSRVLNTLIEQGLIAVHQRTITIHDSHALQRMLDAADE